MKDPDDADVPDPSGLTDHDLKAALLLHGVKAGPIVGEGAVNTVLELVFIEEIDNIMWSLLASTRALYEQKLRKVLGRDEHLNGAEKGALYSDSEDEEDGMMRNAGSEGAKDDSVEQADQSRQEVRI